MSSRINQSSRIAKIIIHTAFFLICVACLVPLILVVSVSLSNDADITKYGYSLIPHSLSFLSYEYLLKTPKQFLDAYGITIASTILGTISGLLVTTMLAYAISRKEYFLRNVTAFYIFFTMLFTGGMVPWYILIKKYLGMNDTIWVLFVPYLVVPFFVLLMKGFLVNIPDSIFESAKIDGASEFKIFFSMVLPLSKPALATVGLFYVLMFWNDWWLSLLFIDKENLVSLQYLLYKIMSNIQFLTSNMARYNPNITTNNIPTLSVRMAMCVIAAGPVLFVFPFFQQYFVKGLTVGAIKG